jgi:hypothetical protein
MFAINIGVAVRKQRNGYSESGVSSIKSVSSEYRNGVPPATSGGSGKRLLGGRMRGQGHQNAHRLRGENPSCE